MSSNKLHDYEVLSVMGAGTFGTCFKVRNKMTKKLFVWKAIDYAHMDDEKRQLLVSEINLLKQLAHPNIVQYFNHILHVTTKTLYIIMECCEGGDLAQLIIRCRSEHCHFEEQFIWHTLYQLSRAIQGCHSHRGSLTILHRDIKPANVFLDLEGNVKLGDFGLARVLQQGDDHFAETVVGTPYYMSPEIIRGTKYNRKSDIWSLGCLIYELCALRPPFTGKHMNMLSKNIADGRFSRIPTVYSCELQQIISFLLSVDHGYRPTIDMILHHPTVVAKVGETLATFPRLISNEKTAWFSPIPNLSSTKVDAFAKDTTYDLRKELFTTPTTMSHETRKTNNGTQSVPEQSNTDNTELFCAKAASEGAHYRIDRKKFTPTGDPNEITQEIFNSALRQRLEAIRHRESMLKSQEDEYKKRERTLLRRERQIRKFEKTTTTADKMGKLIKNSKHNRPINYDASTLSIEPNDTIILPTTAKLDTNAIRRPNGFQRKIVAFRSPPKLKNNNKENIPPQNRTSDPSTVNITKPHIEMTKTLASPGATITTTSEIMKTKRKSIFNMFHLNLNSKFTQKELKSSAPEPQQQQHIIVDDAKCSDTVTAKWTDENKRTAFEMLAIMNAAASNKISKENVSPNSTVIDDLILNNKIVRHDRKRQSMIVLKKYVSR